MSALKSTVSSPEPLYCDTSDNQWGQEMSPNIPQTVTESDLYELSPPNLVPIPTNGSPPVYQAHNGLNLNGANGVSYVQSNLNGPIDRNGANIPHGMLNGMRTLNIPSGLNGTGVMLRPNGNGINMMNGVNGYINAAANQRFLPRPATWITPTKTVNGVKKQKRNRTAFTSQQMMELEQEYARTRYLDRTRRIELSEILHLNERTIKIWFQNRRMKEKKDRAESLEDSEEVSTTESSPELGMSGAVPMPMLIHEQYPTTVTNEVYNRGMYMDYQVSSTPTSVNVMPQGLQHSMGEYAEYVPLETYESQCRQVHLQEQHYPPVYSNELEAVHADPSTPQPDSCSPAEPSVAPEQNWDLSWIKSMQADDEF